MSSFSAILLLALVALVAFAHAGEYRSFDGSGNNINEPSMGVAGAFQTRLLDSNFANLDSPNVRSVSNLLGTEANENLFKNAQGINLFEAFFGQFANHDKENSRNAANNQFREVPLLDLTADVLYSVNATNNRLEIRVSETVDAQLDGKGPVEPQVINHATSWFDLSSLYGNNDANATALRSMVGGLLKTSNYSVFLGPSATVLTNLLPSKNVTGVEITTPLTVASTQILTAGDPRVNENVGLALVTVMFMREHNRLARALAVSNPTMNDEELYQNARRINIAQYQNILIEEYLPAIVSAPHIQRLGNYRGYKKNTQGATSIEFSVGAFRYGHSTVSSAPLINASGCIKILSVPANVFGPFPVTSPSLPFGGQLGGGFGAPLAFASAGGAENILRGLLNGKSNMVDTKFTDVVRNIRFVGAQGRGVDLFSSDMMRGRMTGLPSYHQLRRKFFEMEDELGELELDFGNIYDYADCDSSAKSADNDTLACFSHITSDVILATKLKDSYGKVNKIDGIAGLLSEDHLAGSFLPRTLANIVVAEYKRSREADRFWFEKTGMLTEEEMETVKSRRLAHILRDAFPALTVQDDIFHVVPGFTPSC